MDHSAVHHQLHHHFHHHELGCQSDSQTLENMITCSKPTQQQQQQQQQDPKKPRPPESEPQKCPRCDSTNTKFCYYNNYSLSQPRYFCKSCRRYWTKGGTLRNVPVGGGCRRNKRPSSSSSPSPSFSATSFLKRPHTHDLAGLPPPNHLFSSSFGGGLGLGFGFDHANVTFDFDGFLGHPHNGAGGFLINNNEQQNLGYGFGAPTDEMGIVPFEAGAAMKHEGVESRGLWGLYPWQQMINTNFGDNNHGLMSSMGFGGLSSGNELEQIRGLIGNSAWQGNLLPSPALI
ncbi:hypothetical protein V2J09_000136 [Rumex salicifolius]